MANQKRNNTPANQSHSVPATLGAIDNSSQARFFRLINRLVSNEVQRYRRSQILVFPFFITDEQLREINTEVLRALNEIQKEISIEFSVFVRFEDLSSQKFNTFSEFIERADNKKDPEQVSLIWSKFSIGDDGEPISGRVEITFTTEKRLTTSKSNPDVIHQAEIEYTMLGSNQRWVDAIFEDIRPHLDATAHGGIMRPLWVFRNPFVIQILSYASGYVFLLIESNFFQQKRIESKGINKERADFINQIKKLPTIEKKFDYYISGAYEPISQSTPVRETITYILGAMTAFVIGYIIAKYCFPLLTPNSAIAIGVSRRRALSAIDTFKFLNFFTFGWSHNLSTDMGATQAHVVIILF